MNANNGFVVGDHDRHSPTTLSQKLHSSISNVSCCFCPNKHHQRAISPIHVSKSRLLGRTCSTWTKSRSHTHDHDDHVHGGHLPELKGKCRTLISRISRGCHRRHHSADFHYDPLSYSRNFDDDDTDDAFPFRSFSSRLPQSPPPAKEDGDEDEDEEQEQDDETEPSSTPSSAAEMIIAFR